MKKFDKIFRLKFLATLLVALTTALAFSACSDKDDDDDDQGGTGSLVGTWICESAYGQAIPSGYTITLIINADGTGSMSQYDTSGRPFTQSWHWRTEGNVIYLTEADGEYVDTPSATLYYRLNGSKYLYIYEDKSDFDADSSGNSKMKEIFRRK